MATVVAALLVALGTITYFAVSRAAAIQHQREESRQIEQRIEHLEMKVKAIEREQVQLQTKIEDL